MVRQETLGEHVESRISVVFLSGENYSDARLGRHWAASVLQTALTQQ